MKEKYFTKNTINSKVIEYKNKLYLKKFSFSFNINSSCLIILDMQKFFFDKNSYAFIPSAEAIIDNIKQLISFFRKNQRPIIFTRHINTKENADLMGIWWKNIITKENFLSEIINDFNTTNDCVFCKPQYDAFYKTYLENYLNENEISQLVLTGVMTHLCCETTVRSAFIKGFYPFFPLDTTATYNEKLYLSTFTNLSHGFCSPLISNELFSRKKTLK